MILTHSAGKKWCRTLQNLRRIFLPEITYIDSFDTGKTFLQNAAGNSAVFFKEISKIDPFDAGLDSAISAGKNIYANAVGDFCWVFLLENSKIDSF